MHLVLISKGIDRKHILYSNKGHRHINIKLIAKKLNESTLIHLRQKMQSISERIDKIYKQYDILLEYEIDSDELYILLIRILRYFNSGNQWRIMKNQAAYFQTEVFFETDVTAKSIYVGLDFFVRRTLAANTIQRAWRRSRCGK